MSEACITDKQDKNSKFEIKKILMPNGKLYTFFKEKNETWADVIENKILVKWGEYCNSHWIDFTNHESMYSFEQRVKRFLDRCAWLIMKDNLGNVESEFKDNVYASHEIPISECMTYMSDALYSDRKPPITSDNDDSVERFDCLCEKLDEKNPKKPPKKNKYDRATVYQKIEAVKKKFNNPCVTWCIVDGDNNFVYEGCEFHIPYTTNGYTKEANDEKLNAMDRVLVIKDDNDVRYYSQCIEEIEVA